MQKLRDATLFLSRGATQFGQKATTPSLRGVVARGDEESLVGQEAVHHLFNILLPGAVGRFRGRATLCSFEVAEELESVELDERVDDV